MTRVVAAESLAFELLVQHQQCCFSETYQERFSADGLAEYLEHVRVSGARDLFAFDNENCAAFAALQGDEIVGTVVVSRSEQGCFLWGMYVRECSQRKGVGTLLLKQAMQIFEPDDELYLFPLADRSAAISFYQACGFEALSEGEEEVFPGRTERVLYMRLKVTD